MQGFTTRYEDSDRAPIDLDNIIRALGIHIKIARIGKAF